MRCFWMFGQISGRSRGFCGPKTCWCLSCVALVLWSKTITDACEASDEEESDKYFAQLKLFSAHYNFHFLVSFDAQLTPRQIFKLALVNMISGTCTTSEWMWMVDSVDAHQRASCAKLLGFCRTASRFSG